MIGRTLQLDVNHPVVLGFFPSPPMAELALTDLVEQGVSEQDYALVKIGETDETDHSLDYALEPVGTTGTGLNIEEEGSPEVESAIGGGISTAGPDDDASEVSEMDDGDDAADDLMYPTSGHSFSDEERRDVAVAANTGFFETTRDEAPRSARAEAPVKEMILDGSGLVIGEGSLVSYLLNGQGDVPSLLELLGQSRTLDKGSILAVDVVPDGPNSEEVVRTLTARRADSVEQINPQVQLW